jgi:rhodanese-related sulfurtransferase
MNNRDKTLSHIVTVERLAEELDDVNLHDEFRITVVNLLSQRYFEDCHIRGSINIDAALLADTVEDWDRTRAIVLCGAAEDITLCEDARKTLSKMGFTDIRILQGGMQEWVDQGCPTEGACNMAYLHD